MGVILIHLCRSLVMVVVMVMVVVVVVTVPMTIPMAVPVTVAAVAMVPVSTVPVPAVSSMESKQSTSCYSKECQDSDLDTKHIKHRVTGQYLPTTMSVFMLSQLETEGSRAGVRFIVVPQ